MSEPIIQAKNIGKKYTLGETTSFDTLRDKVSAFFSEKTPQNISEFWALKDITFNIPRGASIGIIGRNGAGKSTLLKILSRITPPTTGEIIMRGSVASLLEVGTGFHSELSGRENIFLNGCILGMSRAEINRKFDQIVDFAEVQGFLDTPVKRYSSGMIVRLAFSIAAHLDPEIMIVDEVLAVGDMQFQKKCLQKMEEVEKKSGKTIFFVSHDTRMVRSLCSHTMLLKNGKLVLFDETPKVISQYLHDKELSSSPEVEINEEHYDQKSKKIIFHKISLFNSKNESTTKIHFYESFSVQMEFTVLKPLKDGEIGFGIKTQDGTWISSFSFKQDKDFSTGKYTCTGTLENILNPLEYTLHVFSREGVAGGGEGRAELPDIIDFEILPFNEKGNPVQLHTNAFVSPKVKWKIF